MKERREKELLRRTNVQGHDEGVIELEQDVLFVFDVIHLLQAHNVHLA
jgi:hypothetical protein